MKTFGQKIIGRLSRFVKSIKPRPLVKTRIFEGSLVEILHRGTILGFKEPPIDGIETGTCWFLKNGEAIKMTYTFESETVGSYEHMLRNRK